MEGIIFSSDITTVRYFIISFFFVLFIFNQDLAKNIQCAINTVSRVVAALCFSQTVVIR